jgi:hypothetical protein
METIPEAFALDWLVATYGITGTVLWIGCLQMAIVALVWPWLEVRPDIHRQTH